MSIRLKIIFIVLPLLVSTLLITGIASSLAAEVGITKVAIEFLAFKANEVAKYADSQWTVLEGNDLGNNQEFVKVAKDAVVSYARSLAKSTTELTLALDSQGQLAASTRDPAPTTQELAALRELQTSGKVGWQTFRLGTEERVAQTFIFEPFGWYIVISEARETFFAGVQEINHQNYIILGVSIFAALVLLLWFAAYLTRPVRTMVNAMNLIIRENNLAHRVQVDYQDEIGDMAQTFNLMVSDLENANTQIKNFALQSVLAQKREQKIRNIFQMYVPAHVLDEVMGNIGAHLAEKNSELAILFSDIRGFTTLSETMAPDELVRNLNRYFSVMVDIIMSKQGVVDKFIGDAIMAFFGAPVQGPNDALAAVTAALSMLEALEVFNKEQRDAGKVEFQIGIGINYGLVTVGNIGSEQKKINYTVIGDMVNLASRLEGLCKQYHQKLVVSESVYQRVGHYVYARMLDRVIAKGKTTGETIYTLRGTLTETEKKAWATYHTGLAHYYKREFTKARSYFSQVLAQLPGDFLAQEFLERTNHCIANPPPPDWTGVEEKHEK